MKRLITCLFLLSTQIFPKTYLVVSYNNGDLANSADLTALKKITFIGTNITYLLNNGDVTLLWETATEKNNYGLEIERTFVETQHSASGGASLRWEKVGFVQGNGNCNSPKQYSFTYYQKAGTKLK